MEYQKIANLFDDSPNKTSKFKTKSWVEINDESRGTFNVGSQIKLKSSLCDIVMHISMLRELLLLIILLLKVLQQIITIKK